MACQPAIYTLEGHRVSNGRRMLPTEPLRRYVDERRADITNGTETSRGAPGQQVIAWLASRTSRNVLRALTGREVREDVADLLCASLGGHLADVYPDYREWSCLDCANTGYVLRGPRKGKACRTCEDSDL